MSVLPVFNKWQYSEGRNKDSEHIGYFPVHSPPIPGLLLAESKMFLSFAFGFEDKLLNLINFSYVSVLFNSGNGFAWEPNFSKCLIL